MQDAPTPQTSQSLPLILAGPILRRVEARAVTVWLALSLPRQVTLKIFATQQQGQQLGAVVSTVTGTTVQLGHSLHVLALTASSRGLSQGQPLLQPGCLYAYDLLFEAGLDPDPESPLHLPQALRSETGPDLCVSYFAHQCPTFALPPAQLDQLQIFHGSCRKTHDRGYDALPILDLAIAHRASDPNQRPHQLFLTGDQIYGDEIADPLLWAIQENCDRLFGWHETLYTQTGQALSAQAQQPGQRTQVAETEAGLTASLKNTPEKAASHLFRFQEYCVAYVLSWSQWGWDLDFPTAKQRGLQGKAADRWDTDVQQLRKLLRSHPQVRRALANVPTYMIFDDHEISDDWNLNRLWCERVYPKSLGRQVVRNGLLAYALFQAWGNSPAQFAPSQLGAQLINQAQRWLQSRCQDQSAAKAIEQLLGLPELDSQGRIQWVQDGSQLRLNDATQVLQWHYRIQGPCHEVLVLDTRTQRGYPADAAPQTIPHLLSPAAFDQQLQPMLAMGSTGSREQKPPRTPRLTFVVAPTNLFSLKLLDRIQRWGSYLGREFDMDVGDSWNLAEAARSELLSRLFAVRDRIIVLTGDIHFSASIHLDYQELDDPKLGDRQVSQSKNETVTCKTLKNKTLVQLTASAFCNSDRMTGFLHTRLKSFLPESERYFQRGTASYRTRWIQRQPAVSPDWQSFAPWVLAESSRSQRPGIPSLFTRLWYSRWLQEGREVVGFNNLGQVTLAQQSPAADQQPLAVIHQVHWYAPWQPGRLVSSRFWTRLD